MDVTATTAVAHLGTSEWHSKTTHIIPILASRTFYCGLPCVLLPTGSRVPAGAADEHIRNPCSSARVHLNALHAPPSLELPMRGLCSAVASNLPNDSSTLTLLW